MVGALGQRLLEHPDEALVALADLRGDNKFEYEIPLNSPGTCSNDISSSTPIWSILDVI